MKYRNNVLTITGCIFYVYNNKVKFRKLQQKILPILSKRLPILMNVHSGIRPGLNARLFTCMAVGLFSFCETGFNKIE